MHPRGWAGRGTGEGGEPRARRGACPLQGGVRGHPGARRGCLPSLPPAHPAFALLSCPLSPNPLPGGKGETKVILCKGLRPLHPRAGRGAAQGKGANHAPGGGRAPYGAGLGGHPGAQRGACPVGCPLSLPLACFSAPYPPTPLPGGKGEIFCLFRRGLPPPAPLRLNPYGAGSTLRKQFLSVMPETFPTIIYNRGKSLRGSGGTS